MKDSSEIYNVIKKFLYDRYRPRHVVQTYTRQTDIEINDDFLCMVDENEDKLSIDISPLIHQNSGYFRTKILYSDPLLFDKIDNYLKRLLEMPDNLADFSITRLDKIFEKLAKETADLK